MDPISKVLSILQASVDDFNPNSIPEDLRDYFKGINMGYLHCISLLTILRDECD